jgi:mono/diheme cytochrome c family protein
MTTAGRWLIVLASVVTASGGAAAPTGESPSGRELAVARNCASCHTVSVVSMPTLDLTDDEITALVEYIQSLGRGSGLG